MELVRKSSEDEKGRTPPGQRLTRGWPVLHADPVPRFDPATWRFGVEGEVENPMEWTWDEFRALPGTSVDSDIHCVTGWSKLDNTWEGVHYRTLAEIVVPKPAARFVVSRAPSGYSANLPIEAMDDDDVLLAWNHDGTALEDKHGGPLRLVVPKRYFWKSTKWCIGLEFSATDQRGFWEVRGYHNEAHPWPEERYSWQEGR
jgi:DMSO/TMAO reductase YedYZ molybdopterin-dependent catalytic subunit